MATRGGNEGRHVHDTARTEQQEQVLRVAGEHDRDRSNSAYRRGNEGRHVHHTAGTEQKEKDLHVAGEHDRDRSNPDWTVHHAQ